MHVHVLTETVAELMDGKWPWDFINEKQDVIESSLTVTVKGPNRGRAGFSRDAPQSRRTAEIKQRKFDDLQQASGLTLTTHDIPEKCLTIDEEIEQSTTI